MSKPLVRNLVISAGLILVAFLAKMEAINFLIALWVAILVLVKTYKPIAIAYEQLNGKIENKISSFPLQLIVGIFLEAVSPPTPHLLLWLLVSGFAGWLTYSILNLLFIS